jgi:hypothetical protein
VPDNQTSAPVGALDRLGLALRRRLEARGGDLIRYHNPFVRHVIKRRRRDFEGRGRHAGFPGSAGQFTRGGRGGRARDVGCYGDARAYCQRIARVRPGAGILKTLLLRRIGSSLRAGLLTARKLRDGDEQRLLAEEDEGAPSLSGSAVDRDALEVLKSAIEKMEAAGDADPKLDRALRYLRQEGWAARGCILFSQYLDTVLWLANQLGQAFPTYTIGIYGGQGIRF